MGRTVRLLALCFAALALGAGRAPNVVLVLLDDVGIDQLGVYDDQNHYTDPDGYAYAHTPNIDALAANGVRFNQFRTMPVCSPTRSSLLSGRYPFRHGSGAAVKVKFKTPAFVEFDRAPSPRFLLLPGVLEKKGIETAAIGKWHLGLDPKSGGTMDSHPNDIGFGTWWGVPRNLFASGPTAGTVQPAAYYDYLWVENMTRVRLKGIHATQQTAERAQVWIATTPEPYFLYLSMNACHIPHGGGNWPPSDHGFGPVPSPPSHVNTGYRACLEHADAKLGEVLSMLGSNTVVILAGDNGTIPNTIRAKSAEVRYPVGHPLHQPGDEIKSISTKPYQPWKVKKSVYEGGIRTPLIISGPGIAAPGRTNDDLVDIVDVYPTIATLTGSKYPAGKLDGRDFSKLLTSATARGQRTWSFSEYFTPNGVGDPSTRTIQKRAYIRRDRKNLWKLIHFVENTPGEAPVDRYEFYRLSRANKALADPLETKDLGTKHPAFQETRRAYLEFVGKG